MKFQIGDRVIVGELEHPNYGTYDTVEDRTTTPRLVNWYRLTKSGWLKESDLEEKE